MSLFSLPNELLVHAVSFVAARSDLASLRLVNKSINIVATEAYFSHIPLYPDWNGGNGREPTKWPNDIEYDIVSFWNILNSERLKGLVKNVTIFTCNPDCDHHPQWSHEQGESPNNQLTFAWDECLNRIVELQNLRRLDICFDRHAASYDTDRLLSSSSDRLYLLKALFEVMERLDGIGISIEDLRIRNLFEDIGLHSGPNLSNWQPAYPTDAQRSHLLGKLKSLRINLVHEQFAPEDGSALENMYSHAFWERFPKRWLWPAMQNLKHLTLYSDVPIGWFPKVDLRNIHFPHLKSLALGQHIFSHDWQFDWIISHAHTLQALYLDNCSILYQIGHSNPTWIKDEGYPLPETHYSWGESLNPADYPDDTTIMPTFTNFPTRWHDIFARFLYELPYLREFRFGTSSQWNFDVLHRYRGNGYTGHPILPWEAEREIKNECFEERYLHFNGWKYEYYTKWSDNEDLDFEDVEDSGWKQEWIEAMQDPPQCLEEDEAALRLLLEKLGL